MADKKKPAGDKRNRGCVGDRKIDIDLLTEWKADGLTNTEIARRFGVTDSAINQAIKRYSVTGHKVPPTLTARTDLAKISVSDQSAAVRLDLVHLLVLGIDQAKRMPVPRTWRELKERQDYITSVVQNSSKLFGWDAKSSAGGGGINVNILATAGQQSVNVDQSPRQLDQDTTPKMCGPSLDDATNDVEAEDTDPEPEN